MTHLIHGLAAVIAASQSQPMTLDEAIKVAEANAFALKISRLSVEKANAKYHEAQGSKGPKVTLDSTYTRFDKELTTQFGTSTIVTRAIDSSQSKLSLALPIDIGGTIGHAISAAFWMAQAAEDQYGADRSQLRLDVRQAYFQALQAEEAVRVFEEAVSLSQARLKNVNARFTEGEVAKVDVLRVETQLRQAESDLVAGKNRLQLAQNLFNNVLGRAIETPVALAPLQANPIPEGDPNSWTEVAKVNRKELQALRKQSNALNSATKASRSGMTPSLAVSFQHTHDWNAQGFSAVDDTTVGVLSLSIPLFDSNVTKSRVAAARKDEETMKLRIAQLELGVSLEVRQAATSWVNAQARLRLAEQQVATASENFRLAQLKFDAGEGINLEVVDAQNQLTAARVARLAALYDAQTAFAQLQKAVGADDLKAEQAAKGNNE